MGSAEEKYYLSVSYAKDLPKKRERFLYRLFEIMPGFLSWTTIAGAIILSRIKPLWMAIFIVAFVFYWFAKAIYFSVHLKFGYRKMKENQKIDWLKELESLPKEKYSISINNWREIYHLIILPMYKEPIEIVRESLNSIVKSAYPKEKMIVFLALEERAGKHSFEIEKMAKNEFSDKFFHFATVIHPANVPGEIPAKSANETWAAKRAKEFADKKGINYENIIFSSFDIDSVIYPHYFSRLSFCYLTSENPTRASFQPIPLFLNNIWQVPFISRVFSFSTTFWHLTNQEREEKLITFSSHSMSFLSLVEVNFKKSDVISDDSRIFWQCLLKYDGNYRTIPLYYPISMDANMNRSFFKTMLSIYKQQKRWAYGAGDIAYFLFGFIKNKKIPLRRKISLGWELIEGHWSWACAPILLFLLGWLPTTIGGYGFSQSLIGYNLPRIISKILTIAMIGLITSAYYAFYILPPKTKKRKLNMVFIFLEWLLLPMTMIFFTALPALSAQTHWILGRYISFWVTPKSRKDIKTTPKEQSL